MSVSEIPLNLSNLNNITAPSVNISSDPTLIFQDIISSANNYTSDWLGFFILGVLSFILYWVLSDRTPFGDFKYDDMRALSISLGIASIIGLKAVELQLIYNFITVAQFCYLFLITLIFILFYENRE